MNTTLRQAQIKAYQENGFVVLEDFLRPEELETWRNAVDEAVAARGKTKLAGREGQDGWQEKDGYYDRVFVQRINLWQDSAAVRELMFDAQLGKMAATLAGVEGVRIWHDQALIKQPWGNPTGWHLDNPYWSFFSKNAISVWVALDDATLENGLSLLRAGHTQKRDLRERRHRSKYRRPVPGLSCLGWPRGRGRADEGGVLFVSQRSGRPRGRGQHDA